MRTIDELFGAAVMSALCMVTGCAPLDDAEGTDDAEPLAQEAAADVDVTGTWGVSMQTSSEISAPLIGKSASTAKLAMRFHVTKEEDQYRANVQICTLSTDSATLKVNYVNVLPHLKTSMLVPAFEPKLGGEVPFPDLVFRIGQDESGAARDADEDGRQGVTVPVVALGLLSMNAYTGFELKVGLDAVLTDTQTIEGSYSFGAIGKVFGSSSPLLPAGELRVTQTAPSARFTAKRFEGDLPCAELIKRL